MIKKKIWINLFLITSLVLSPKINMGQSYNKGRSAKIVGKIFADAITDTSKKFLYFGWTIGVGGLIFPKNTGQMQITFPYTSTDASGNISKNIFTSKLNNLYTKPQIMASVINFELGGLRSFCDARIYFDIYNGSQGNFSCGYGYNFYFDLPKNKSDDLTERRFVFKPSINIGFNQYRISTSDKKDSYIGYIDNKDKTVDLLGYTSPPTVISTHKNGNTKETDTVISKEIAVDFAQNNCVIIPKISLSGNHYKHYFRWELSLAFYQPIAERAGIQLYQNETKKLNSKGLIGLDENGVKTTFNQHRINASPYNFSGFFVGITFGFNVCHKLTSKPNRNSKK